MADFGDFQEFFGLRKFWKTIEIHEILLIYEICLRMHIFASHIELCFMPLNEHFTCKNMIVKIFRTPKILEDHKNSWNSSKLWNLPKNTQFLHHAYNCVLCPQKNNLPAKPCFSRFFGLRKFWKTIKIHEILLNYKICPRMHIFALRI